MKKLIKKMHIRFQISLLLIIFVILAISTFSTLYAVISISRHVSTQKAEQLFNETSQSIRLKLDSQLEKAIQTAALMTTLPLFTAPVSGDGTEYAGLPFLYEALERNSYIYSIYAGFSEGDFLQLIRTSSNPEILSAHRAPEGCAYILRTITGSGSLRTESWVFLGAEREIIGRRQTPHPDFQPGKRPWFLKAMENPGTVILTDPYVYNSLGKPGLTAAAAADGNTAVGVDITLSDLKSFIDSIRISANTGIMILDSRQRVLAADSSFESWLGTEGQSLYLRSEISAEKTAEMHSDKYLLWDSPWITPGGQSCRLLISAPVSDFISHQFVIQKRIIIISAIIFFSRITACISDKHIPQPLPQAACRRC